MEEVVVVGGGFFLRAALPESEATPEKGKAEHAGAAALRRRFLPRKA